MARKTNAALAFALSAALALGTIPAPALAEMAEEAMGAEPVATTQPAPKPATDPAPARPAAPVEAQMGEEPVTPQSDPASGDAELGTAPIADADSAAQPADPAAPSDVTDLSTQSTVASGTWGTCPWDIDNNGTLTVRPGTGAEPSQMTEAISPWSEYKDQIRSVKFKAEGGNKVVLPKYAFALFARMHILTSVDFSGADSSNTTMLHWAFYDCSSLTTTDGLSSLDVSKVENMTGLFYDCSSLTSLAGISGWNCANVKEFGSMFEGCTSLASIDGLSSWSFSNARSMSYMFEGCTSLSSLAGASNWSFPNVESMDSMFSNCTSLASLTGLSNWSFPSGTEIGFMFSNCTSLTSLGGISNWSLPSERIYGLFTGCTSLASLDPIRNWNTSNVKSLPSMFSGCTSLASLEPIRNWSTSNMTDMSYMFRGCTSLASLEPISGWNTSNVRNLAYMFSGCTSLSSLDPIRDWSTSNVNQASRFLEGCTSLTSLEPIRNWSTSNLRLMDGMFSGCTSLTSLEPIHDWDTSNATMMWRMFSGCTSLRDVDLSGWNTSELIRVDYMFSGCSQLASLNISSWDTAKVTLDNILIIDNRPFETMFDGCSSLSRITVGAGYDMKARGMFPTELAGRLWRSTATGQTYTGGEIVANRSRVADTYTLEGPGITPKVTSLGGTDWSAVYDPEWYAVRNPDVSQWAARADGSVDGNRLLQHFVNNGRKEGRSSKQDFELASYFNANPDLRKAFGNDWSRYYQHYATNGAREHRTCSGVGRLQAPVTFRDGVDWAPVYDALLYANANVDAYEAAMRKFASGYVVDDEALLSHFLSVGTKECRTSKFGFSISAYYNANPDLRAAFGGTADWTRYYRHYATNGQREGRWCSNIDRLQGSVTKLNGTDWSAVYDRAYYAQKNADVVTWATRKCGSTTVLDDYAMLTHFVNNGRKEGRASKATFELASYYNANPDLRRAFGNDWTRYYEHYRANGWREGRRCVGVGQLQGAPTTAEGVNWSPVYDANYYAQRNADVANWARRSFSSGSVLDDAALLSHFVGNGTREARASKSTFNVRAYKNKNADLVRAFGNDWKSYYRHYAKFGVNEHRACT